MPAPQEILDLIDRFDRNLQAYKQGRYNETQVRIEFIDPFFTALGWDINNKSGHAEKYKDVFHEDKIKIGGDTKAPDYSFRIGGTRKFFLEAKKPLIDIKNDISPAYQLRRYAWSAKLPLGILTDFEEFAVYDCRNKPEKTDKASTGRVQYFTYKDYPDKWDEISSIFSREAILKGSFDKYAESTKAKRGTTEVDDMFLKEIESWREQLARNIALRNPAIGQRELNFAVQQTIDRIIFLRICEDRGIEPYGKLKDLQTGSGVYPRLVQIFQLADARYNSGLFHFEQEKGRIGHPDLLTPALTIDDKILKDILQNLYYPDSPYEFSVLPADILGQVYEQFLGKVIRLTAGHQAKVEEKPEVRKAGGVYYTPTYIVNYIVQQTVGKLVVDKRPGPMGGVRKLSVIDPACGSGSFLLGAYQFLLDWHLDQYVNDREVFRGRKGPERWSQKENPQLYQTDKGEWRLTIDERKRILINNIYGVDIDPQAVEVTKLSLLLKVLEGESDQTLNPQMALFRERVDRVLPDLANNIRCGNSLIGPDFYDGQLGLLDDEEAYRVNVFDWKSSFPAIFADGGFDAVIGNPPYVRPHNIDARDKAYFWKIFSTFVKKSDLYVCFIEKSVELLRQGGYFGFIVSNGWLRLDSFEILRKHILDHVSIETVIEFTDYVFENARVKTAILTFNKNKKIEHSARIAITKARQPLSTLNFRLIVQDQFKDTFKSIFDLSLSQELISIKQKIVMKSTELGKIYELAFGFKTGDDVRFLSLVSNLPEHKPVLRGADIHRYSYEFKGEYVWYVPDKMIEHRRTARPGNAKRFEQPKILIRDTGGELESTFDDSHFYTKDVIIVFSDSADDRGLKYLTGVVNSKLMGWYYETSFPTLHVQRDEVAQLPIRTIDFTNPTDVAQHDRMVNLVQRMLDLHKQIATTTIPHQKDLLQRQIDSTDRQIDQLVYDLYGLTADEIPIVEGRAIESN